MTGIRTRAQLPTTDILIPFLKNISEKNIKNLKQNWKYLSKLAEVDMSVRKEIDRLNAIVVIPETDVNPPREMRPREMRLR